MHYNSTFFVEFSTNIVEHSTIFVVFSCKYSRKKQLYLRQHLYLKVVPKLRQNCLKVVSTYLKVVSKLTQGCPDVVPKLFRCCPKVVMKLPPSFLKVFALKVVLKLHPSCLQVVQGCCFKSCPKVVSQWHGLGWVGWWWWMSSMLGWL